MSALPGDLRTLYPFAARYLDLDGVRMHYVDEGSGPVVLMLHGNPTWSFYYRELIKGLRDRYRVIAPDHIGCGLSDKPRDYPYTLATHIRNVTTLVERLDLHEVRLIVHDWGGAIGFGWATRHAERARAFVVFNSAAFLGPCPLRIRLCRVPLVGDVLVRGFNAFARGATYLACKRRGRMTIPVRRGYLWPYRSRADRIGVLRFVQDIPLSPHSASYEVVRETDANLPRLRDRAMLIGWGGRDFCFHDGFLASWTARFPEAEVHRFAEAGHYVVEDAIDEILPLVRGFLQRQDAGTGPGSGG